MLSFYLSMLSDPDDHEKMTRLYYKYRQLMVQVATNILFSKHDAEDAVHEAFIRVAKNLHKIHGINNLETKIYLITIVRRVCYSMGAEKSKILRHSIWHDDDEEVDVVVSIPDKSPLPADIAHRHSVREILMNAIDKLKPGQRDVLVLYYMEGRNAAEVAELLEISTNAVYKRLKIAIETIREILLEEGYDAEDLRI